jgi:D-galactarolactone isomerase
MNTARIGRRAFLQGAGVAALSAAGLLDARLSYAQDAAPNSSGTGLPKLKAPANACDCHHHIYDVERFPPAKGGTMPNARVAEYRLLQRRIGTTRSVVVTPSLYGTDNSVTLDAMEQFGGNARGVAVIDTTITDTALATLNRGGIRGIRFSVSSKSGAAAPAGLMDMIEPLAKRVSGMGWHVQINMPADQIVAAEDLWMRLPATLVFDHMGHVPQPAGISHPVYPLIRKLIDKGHTWVKLSVTYDNTKDGPPTYADVTKVAQGYVQAAPQRCVWGTNWPHPGEEQKPDDAVVFDLLSQWAPDDATRHRILVENPETLYGFAKSAKV